MKYHIASNRARSTMAVFVVVSVILTGCVSRHLVPHLDEGKKYAAAGEWDKSVNALQKAQEIAPDNKEVKLLLNRSRYEASMAHMEHGEQLMAQELFTEAIAEFKIAMAMNLSNMRAARLSKLAQDMQEARHLYRQGVNFERTRKFAQAKAAFIRANKLDPDYEPALEALERYRGKELESRKYRLDLKSESPISFKFKKTPIINVFEVLTQLTGVNFIFDKEMPESKVTMFMTDVSFDRFIDVLLKTNDLASQMVNENTMIIYPNTPAKIKEYQDLQIRTFYLSNMEAKKAVALLSKILRSKDIIANESLNSLVVRGSGDVIKIAERLIEANDGAPAEILLDVEFLEVTKSLEENLGLTVTEFIDLGVGEATDSISNDLEFAANASIRALSRISDKELVLSIPTATLNLLKQDGDTRILAQPKIRVKNAEKASVLLGDRVPLRVNRRVDSNTGDVTSDFQYTDVGVKLEVAPIINIHDEVTLNLTLEVSSLGANISTDPTDPQFPIQTRTAKSVISLRDGETVILGGLINDTERETIRKVPLLGEIPSVGRLFSNRDTSNIKNDVFMVITPYVIRSQEIPENEYTRIWSGSQERWSTESPYGEVPFEETLKKTPEGPLPEIEPGPAGALSRNSDPEADLPGARPSPAASDAESNVSATSETSEAISVATAATGQAEAAAERSEAGWPADARFAIHVNSYTDETQARERTEALAHMGYDSFMIPASVPGKGFFHRIFVGSYPSLHLAQADCDRFKDLDEFARDIHVVDRKWAIGD